jgi:hypothetical protein
MVLEVELREADGSEARHDIANLFVTFRTENALVMFANRKVANRRISIRRKSEHDRAVLERRERVSRVAGSIEKLVPSSRCSTRSNVINAAGLRVLIQLGVILDRVEESVGDVLT